MKSSRGNLPLRGRMVETNVYTQDGVQVMQYHNTKVARAGVLGADPSKIEVFLDTGGYFTATTKKRMNQFAEMFDLPFVVYQNKKVWYVDIRDGLMPPAVVSCHEFNGNTCSFTITK